MSYYGNTQHNPPSSGGGFYGQQQQQHQQQQQQQQQQPGTGFVQPPPQQQQDFGGGGYSSNNSGNASFQQWQAPSQQPYGQPQQRQQQQQQQQYNAPMQPQAQPGLYMAAPNSGGQQQPAQSFWNPATAATMAAVAGSVAQGGIPNDPALYKMGLNYLQGQTASYLPGLQTTMIMLRSYFAVDNRYVLQKMKKILFPFLSHDWQRRAKEAPGPDPSMQHYDLPIADENAPDLYLPLMSLITYVLLCAVCYGTAGKFDPEVIGDVTMYCLATQIVEVAAIRCGFYLMQTNMPLLDLLCYTGYKYLGLCLNMLIGLIMSHFGLGARGYYLIFLWTASAASFFMLKTMGNNIPLETAHAGPKREVMVLVFAASQFLSMWFMSKTKFL